MASSIRTTQNNGVRDDRDCPCSQIHNAQTNKIWDENKTSSNDAEKVYMLPSSAKDSARLELQAQLMCAVMNHQVVHSPVSRTEATAVLEVGCGTGFVTDTMGRRFPNATVYGLDISAVPEVARQRPHNVRFIQGDILGRSDASATLLQTTLPDDHFDLIFSRLLIFAINDWDEYFTTAYHLLKPGGWLEIHEINWMIYSRDASNPNQLRAIANAWPWFRLVRSSLAENGMDEWAGSRAAIRMSELGFDEIITQEYEAPLSGEGEKTAEMKATGEYMAENLPRLTLQMLDRILEGKKDQISEQEGEALKEQMWSDLRPIPGRTRKMYVTCGRRPMTPLK